MNRVFAIASLFIALIPSLGLAQFVPTLGNDAPSACPDQPAQPAWVDNMPFREAHRQLLAQQMYRAQSMQAVVESGECSCETRFPAWDEVQALFLEAYADLDRWGATKKTEEYRGVANDYRKIAMPICEAEGNW